MAVFIDDELNADWLRSMGWGLPDDADGFLLAIQAGTMPEGQGDAVRAFMDIPAAKAMPAKLRSALEQRGLL